MEIKKKKYNLDILKINLLNFNSILHSNCIKIEENFFYNFKDLVFDLDSNIFELNFILNHYDVYNIKDTQNFLQKN